MFKRMCSGECVKKGLAERPKKRWIESVRECLIERKVNLVEARRGGGHDCGLSPEDEPYNYKIPVSVALL